MEVYHLKLTEYPNDTTSWVRTVNILGNRWEYFQF